MIGKCLGKCGGESGAQKQNFATRVGALNQHPKADWIFERCEEDPEVATTENPPAAAELSGAAGEVRRQGRIYRRLPSA